MKEFNVISLGLRSSNRHVLKHGLSGLVSFGWSHFIGLVWSLWTFHWSSLYFSLFIIIINHNVTYWCCLFYNSHSDYLYQYVLYSIYDWILYIYTIVSITK